MPATTAPRNAATEVDIRYIAFHPKAVTIKSGQTVRWTFDDGGIAHNVTGDRWHSSDQTSGDYTHRFEGPGTYSYRCTLHAGMTGDVTVAP